VSKVIAAYIFHFESSARACPNRIQKVSTSTRFSIVVHFLPVAGGWVGMGRSIANVAAWPLKLNKKSGERTRRSSEHTHGITFFSRERRNNS
jgi:hypothetical protein